jgi:succinyl-CoA synthetase alpha subunit
VVKLGAIGGTQALQLEQSRLFTPGSVAVISSSGGMVNEVIRTVATSGHALSFSLALGGERFPMLTPEEAFLAAESDPNTQAIAYFGELGGDDEYVLVDLLMSGRITTPTPPLPTRTLLTPS